MTYRGAIALKRLHGTIEKLDSFNRPLNVQMLKESLKRTCQQAGGGIWVFMYKHQL